MLVHCWYGVCFDIPALVHYFMVLVLYGNVLYGAVCAGTANIVSINLCFEWNMSMFDVAGLLTHNFERMNSKDIISAVLYMLYMSISNVNHAYQVHLEPDDGNPGKCTLLLSGYVRAHSLSVNQLVSLSFFNISFFTDLAPMCLHPFSKIDSCCRCRGFSVRQDRCP